MNAPRKSTRSTRMVAPPTAALVEHLEPHLGAMISVIRDLVQYESPSSNKQAVDELGQYLADAFRSAGARVTMHWSDSHGDHMQADFEGEGASEAERVLLL